jgi:hypothetical protein
MAQAGSLLGVYGGLLLANQALLSATGSEDKINVTDPSKPDFFAFKPGGGVSVGVGSGFVGIARLISRLYQAEFAPKKKGLGQLEDRAKKAGGIMGEYARGLAAPGAAIGADLITGEDITERPLPGVLGERNVGTTKQQALKPQYGYGEYAGQIFLPIPFSEALRNFYTDLRANGFSGVKAKEILKGVAEVGVGGLTGFRVNEMQPEAAKNVLAE